MPFPGDHGNKQPKTKQTNQKKDKRQGEGALRLTICVLASKSLEGKIPSDKSPVEYMRDPPQA
jgi:hypothetical protein